MKMRNFRTVFVVLLVSIYLSLAKCSIEKSNFDFKQENELNERNKNLECEERNIISKEYSDSSSNDISKIIYEVKKIFENVDNDDETNKLSHRLNRNLDFNRQLSGKHKLINVILERITTTATCAACTSLMAVSIKNSLVDKQSLGTILKIICSDFKISTERVCNGIIDQYLDTVDYIRKKSALSSSEMCGVLLGAQCFSGNSKNLNWKLEIPAKPDNQLKKNFKIEKTSKVNDQKVYQIIQLTDIHFDDKYLKDREVECGEPLCCRDSNSKMKSKSGYWGTYPCDLPNSTLLNALSEIANNAKDVDLWYLTGDDIAHDIWAYDRNHNIKVMEYINRLVKGSTNKIVIPAVGNHEAVPNNCFSPPSITNEFSMSWLYNELANLWSKWLPEKALKTVRIGGYYSLQIRPGFRVIVMNTNYCARLNFWSLYNPIDPADHLKWLAQELLTAEQVGDSVHIVSHVVPDKRECTQAWIYNYLAIVERFKDTIVAQFYGHTHADEFRVLYSNNNYSQPIGYQFISPSLSTFDAHNPAYRIFKTDPKGVILDVDTYYFNLTQANQISNSPPNNPRWKLEYSMAKAYSISNFTNEEFDKIIDKLKNSDSYLQTYYQYYYRMSDAMPSHVCDNDCKNTLINDIIVSNAYKSQTNFSFKLMPKILLSFIAIIFPIIYKYFY